ncbi:MAG: hypothetical protein GW809_06745 [Bacteroidetes bacterium]|nr:hypothetical protein [Bacteroidota bacterium]
MKFFRFLPLLIVVLSLSISCDNHADHSESDHAEPVGFFLRESGATLVTYQGGIVSGEINVADGSSTALISIAFIDADGDEFTPVGDEYSLKLETNSTFFDFTQHEEDGKWNFHVDGKTAGTGTFVVKLYHGEHSDFLSKDISVVVSGTTN